MSKSQICGNFLRKLTKLWKKKLHFNLGSYFFGKDIFKELFSWSSFCTRGIINLTASKERKKTYSVLFLLLLLKNFFLQVFFSHFLVVFTIVPLPSIYSGWVSTYTFNFDLIIFFCMLLGPLNTFVLLYLKCWYCIRYQFPQNRLMVHLVQYPVSCNG